MCAFQTGLPERATLDPSKRVNYSFGLVLGVDEFAIEQNYFVEKDRLHNRALHGYGVVSGLRVSMRDEPVNPEVVVGPGLAVDQRGREICVDADQCARINTWLQRNREVVRQHLGLYGGLAPSGETLELNVVLCYRECETDVVEIAGRPCASDDESRAPSRIAESFELSLRLARPETREEDVVRRFGDLLGQIAISVEPGPALSAEELSDLVRGLATGGYPLGGPPLRLRPYEACAALAAAFRTWVAEVRPALVGNCAGGPEGEGCLPIARLVFAVVDYRVQGPVKVEVDERPVLLHTRLLQEWLMCGRPAYAGAASHFATVFASDPGTVRVWIHHPALLSIPLAAVRVELDGVSTAVLGVSQPAAGVNVFDLSLAGGAGSFPAGPIQHKQRIAVHFDAGLIDETGSAVTPLAEVLGPGYDVVDRRGATISAYGVAELPSVGDLTDVEVAGVAEGDVLIRRGEIWAPGQALKAGDAAGGDLDGTYPDPTVVGLRGRALTAVNPNNGQLLAFADATNEWQLVPADALASGNLLSWISDKWQRVGQPATGSLEVGHLLAWDGTRWVAQGQPAAGDPKNGHLLAWDGTRWVAQGQPAAGDPKNGHLLAWDGTKWVAQGQPATGSLLAGHLLAWDGTRWAPVGAGATNGQVLGWNGSEWAPTTVTTGGGGLTIAEIAAQLPTIPFVTITRASFPKLIADSDAQIVFQLWFHLDGGPVNDANIAELLTDFEDAVSVFGERDNSDPASSPYLSPFAVTEVKRVRRNVFAVVVDRQNTDTGDDIETCKFLRFIFQLDSMKLEPPIDMDLRAWLSKIPVKWVGHDGDNSITAFYELPQERVVAAGRFRLTGKEDEPMPAEGKILGNLSARLNKRETFVLLLQIEFLGLRPGGSYIIKGTPIAQAGKPGHLSFFVAADTSSNGILVGVRHDLDDEPTGVMIEVTELF